MGNVCVFSNRVIVNRRVECVYYEWGDVLGLSR